jgi:hypothetical protein
MELILIVGGLVVLDILAMRFGTDSRLLDVRDRQDWWPDPQSGDALNVALRSRVADLRLEARMAHLAGLAGAGRPSLRVRLADGLRTVAARIEPACCVTATPARLAS